MTVQETSFAKSVAAAAMLVLITTSAQAQYAPVANPYAAQSPFYQASQAVSAMPMTGVAGCTTTCVPQVAQICTPIRYRVENRPTTVVENREIDRCVLVPQTTTEKRTIKTTEVQPVTREREVTIYEQRPENRVEERKVTVMAPVRKVRTERYTEMRPVTETRPETYTVQIPVRVQRTVNRTEQRPTYKTVKQKYTVQVPQVETRKGTRTVCKCVPVQKQRTVYRDSGYWAHTSQTVSAPTAAPISYQTTAALPVSSVASVTNGCVSACCVPVDCCQTTCGTSQVWVPQRTAHLETYTAMQETTAQEPYEYQVTTFKPEVRERTVQVQTYQTVQVPEKVEEVRYRTVQKSRDVQITKLVPEEKTRDVRYTAYEPRTKTEKVRVTAYRTVPVKRKEKYTEMVPRTVEREIDVPTTRMVERRFKENVAVTVQRNNPVTVAEVGTPTVTAGAFGGQIPGVTAQAIAQQQAYVQQIATGGATAYGAYNQQAYAQAYARQQQMAALTAHQRAAQAAAYAQQQQAVAAAYARQAAVTGNPYAPQSAAVPNPFAVPRTAAAPFGFRGFGANPYQRPRTLADSMVAPFLRR